MGSTFSRIAAAMAGLLAGAMTSAFAATLTVTTTADHGPGSLRDAIGIANVNGVDDTIQFAPALAGATITLTSGELEIDEGGTTLTITAEGLPGGVTVSGGRSTRVFDIVSGATVVFESLVIADGLDDYGAGILSDGSVTLRRCWVTRNVARHGLAGGLYQFGAFLSIEQSTFSENVCVGDSDASGGGAYLYSATADIVNSTFSGNCAVAALGTAYGGAIFPSGGGVSIRHCTFTLNRARGLNAYGGAWVAGGLASVSHSILAANEALFGPEIYSPASVVHSD